VKRLPSSGLSPFDTPVSCSKTDILEVISGTTSPLTSNVASNLLSLVNRGRSPRYKLIKCHAELIVLETSNLPLSRDQGACWIDYGIKKKVSSSMSFAHGAPRDIRINPIFVFVYETLSHRARPVYHTVFVPLVRPQIIYTVEGAVTKTAWKLDATMLGIHMSLQMGLAGSFLSGECLPTPLAVDLI